MMSSPAAPGPRCSPLSHPQVVAPAGTPVRREFPVRGAGLLGLTIEPQAAVTITGWDQDRVVVQVGAEGAQPGGLEFSCGATERGPLWVHAYDSRPDAGAPCALRVEVRVPRRFAVVLNAPRATVLVTNVEGRVTRYDERGTRNEGRLPASRP